MEKRISLSLFLFLFSINVFSQKRTIVFQHIGLEDGLPEGQITALMKASNGFIWMGTMKGLVRYDGYDFVLYEYDPVDSTSLSHPIPSALLEDENGDIWVGTTDGLNRLDIKTNKFQQYLFDPDDPQKIPYNGIRDLYKDHHGILWIGTAMGLVKFDGETFEKVPLPENLTFPNARSRHDVWSIVGQQSDTLWIGSSHGLILFTQGGKEMELLQPENIPQTFQVYKVFRDEKGVLWIGSRYGLFQYHINKKEFKKIPLPVPFSTNEIKNILQDHLGNFWVVSRENVGLLWVKADLSETHHYKYQAANIYGLGNNRVSFLEMDELHQLWIGTHSGLNILDLGNPRFSFLQQTAGLGHAENLIYRAALNQTGGLWYNTYNGSLFFSESIGEVAEEEKMSILENSYIQVHTIASALDREIWMGSVGIPYIFYIKNRQWKQVDLNGSENRFTGHYLEEDLENPAYVWFSNNKGLGRLHKPTGLQDIFSPSEQFPELINNSIPNAIQLPGEYIYLHLENFKRGRLGRFHKPTGRFELLDKSWNYEGRNRFHIRQLAHTPDGTLWFASAQGLGKYTPKTKEFKLIDGKDGLTESHLMGIATDKKGNVWLKSLHYLMKYEPSTGNTWSFSVLHDMREFNTVGASVGPNGHILFSGNNGFYYFHPDSVRLDATKPQIVLTDFEVLHESEHFGTSPELIQEITLTHEQNVFAFKFAALNVKMPQYCRYKYKLEGFDKDWIEAGADRKAHYTNLKARAYTFKAIASNADGIWNEEELVIKLTILPPWWLSLWAKTLYGLLAISMILGIYQFQVDRKLQEAETRRLKELDQFKTRLYTNITHEFRTPLTVIGGMAKQIEEKNYKDKWLNNGMAMIKRNTRQLLLLVNQILDLSKLETGYLKLHQIQGNVISYIHYIIEPFYTTAETNGIELKVESQQTSLFMDYDPERLAEIISNLLSNAIKFTPEGGEVRVQLAVGSRQSAGGSPKSSVGSQQSTVGTNCRPKTSDCRLKTTCCLLLTVKDTGIGISQDKLPHIFDRFYQVDDSPTRLGEGTGIGLAIAKELSKLMGGDIYVKSILEVGSEFTLMLPISQNVPIAEHKFSYERSLANNMNTEETLALNGHSILPKVLIIEDNKDVVRYLTDCLSSAYHISVAYNGKEGIQKAIETVPDIIISDVMMPQKNGFEVCDTLKKDKHTSHIPIILLTAKADMPSKIEGLQMGADAFLIKPFNKQELMVRLQKLLELRRNLQKRYKADDYIGSSNKEKKASKLSDTEEKFLQKLHHTIEKHLLDKDLDVEKLCRLMGMSRTQLHNKIKALTGQYTTRVINQVRLTKAIDLLKHTDSSIKTIAYEVGFGSPNRFSTYFSKIYGKSPLRYRKEKMKR